MVIRPALHKDGGQALQCATKTADKNNGGQALQKHGGQALQRRVNPGSVDNRPEN